MKNIDAKIPGFVDIFIEGDCNKHIIRRDFIDDYDHLQLGISKRYSDRQAYIKPVIDAGLLFFRELGIHGYTLCYHFTKGIPKGYHLESDDYLKAVTICSLNEITNSGLSHQELVDLCNKMSINMDTFISSKSVYFNQDGIIQENRLKNEDRYIVLIKLPERFTQEELVKYFMKGESLSIGLEDYNKYKELIDIKTILRNNNAREISTNGYSNILVATFNDVHERFKASQELSDYESRKINIGNGYSYIKCYK